ncbi:MAG: BtpA/SgcQ family protein [Hyphomicrobiales bacterium]
MDRTAFRKLFSTVGPAILPVIHVSDAQQAVRNVELALGEGAQGVFLINHDFPHDELVPIIEHVRRRFPGLWLGVNFLAVTGRDAFPILGNLEARGIMVDAYWADDARIDERTADQTEAREIADIRLSSGWSGLYFGGTAFKKQRDVAPEDYERAAAIAAGFMDAVTTSGVATGEATDLSKVETFRRGCGDHALAIASGVTPDNVHLYAGPVDGILVATGINFEGDFYNVDPERLRVLIARACRAGLSGPCDN